MRQPVEVDKIKPMTGAGSHEREQVAERIKEELKGKGAKRGLMLIIDDSPEKIKFMGRELAKHARSTGIDYVIYGETDGLRGIALCQEFEKMAPGEKVFVFIDGELPGQQLDRGHKIAKRLVEVTSQQGLPMPFIVGGSRSAIWNENIREVTPKGIYLGEFDQPISIRHTLRAINGILSVVNPEADGLTSRA